MRPSRLSRSASNKASEAWGSSDHAAQPGMTRRRSSSRRRGQGEGTGPDWDSADSSIVISDEATDHDLIDHHHGNHSVSECGSPPLELSVSQGKAVIGGKVTGQTERGVESDAESCCSLDSIVSGPSFMVQGTPLTLPPGLCLTCQRLHREAQRGRPTPLDKLTDNGEYTQTHPPCQRSPVPSKTNLLSRCLILIDLLSDWSIRSHFLVM